ncbi:MAG: hypothetical protein RJA91_968 [Pseudomonadota bacterium]|jgi:hypothetical protein
MKLLMISLMLIGVVHASQHCKTYCSEDAFGNGQTCDTQCYDY